MNDLVYLPEEEALGELKRHRDYITGKANRVPEKAPSTTPGKNTRGDFRGASLQTEDFVVLQQLLIPNLSYECSTPIGS